MAVVSLVEVKHMPESSSTSRQTKKHKNNERTVKCPVEECGKETLARGIHLHVSRKSGDGHGESGEIPKSVNLDNLETVGTQEVEMDYPEERDTEQVARLCPYCERPFRGKHGVMIHLGQVAGRKNHPENGSDKHEPDDFAIVHVDENKNVIETVEEGTIMPSTERRQKQQGKLGNLSEEQVREFIEDLREQGLDEEADRAETMLLSD